MEWQAVALTSIASRADGQALPVTACKRSV